MNNKLNIPVNLKERLEWLFNVYETKLCGYAAKVYGLNEDAARDVFYKAIYKISETIDKYEFESPEKQTGFVFRVFINFLKNYLRDNKDRETVYIEDIKTELRQVLPENSFNNNLELLKEELDKLQDWERILLLLRSQEMAYSEIAKYVGKPEGQLKVYYQRLKNKLSERLSNQPEFKLQSK